MRPSLDLNQSVAAGHCIEHLLFNPKMRKATRYLDDDTVVKATRQRKHDGRSRQSTFLVTVGRPNYAERQFIKECKQVGVPIPLRKVQLAPYPKRRS